MGWLKIYKDGKGSVGVRAFRCLIYEFALQKGLPVKAQFKSIACFLKVSGKNKDLYYITQYI